MTTLLASIRKDKRKESKVASSTNCGVVGGDLSTA